MHPVLNRGWAALRVASVGSAKPARALSAGRLTALGAHPGSTTGC